MSTQHRSPAPELIAQVRTGEGLTVREASALIRGSVHAWEAWERGERRMHPGLWELFLTKIRQKKPAG